MTAAAAERPGNGLLFFLVILVTLTACGSAPATHQDAVVSGTVSSAPSCPVERADSPCSPRPVAGALVEALVAGKVRARTHTDSSGRFQLSMPYGNYTIRATNAGALRTTATKTVYVDRATVSITLIVDSGIRSVRRANS